MQGLLGYGQSTNRRPRATLKREARLLHLTMMNVAPGSVFDVRHHVPCVLCVHSLSAHGHHNLLLWASLPHRAKAVHGILAVMCWKEGKFTSVPAKSGLIR